MKRILQISLAALLLTTIVLPASAENSGDQPASTVCTVRADSVSGKAGETVTVPVTIENNPGFTNFGIALDFDRKQLELVSIQLADEQQESYLCGNCADFNISWIPGKDSGEGFNQKLTYGYVTCALMEAAAEDGVMFTATFRLSETFGESVSVTPVVAYIRSQSAAPSVFNEVQVQIASGTISGNTESSVQPGDVNGDSYITADDAASAFAASKDSSGLTQEQRTAADVNRDGYITADDAAQIFAMSKSRQ